MPGPAPTADPGATPGSGSAEPCPPNIGPAEHRKRRIAGIAGLSAAALVTLLLVWDGAPRGWRLLLILPWWTGFLGTFQARARVCVALAARGLRKLEAQQEPQPAHELEAVRREARRIHMRSALAALAITLLAVALP